MAENQKAIRKLIEAVKRVVKMQEATREVKR